MHNNSWGLLSKWGSKLRSKAYKSYKTIIFENVKMRKGLGVGDKIYSFYGINIITPMKIITEMKNQTCVHVCKGLVLKFHCTCDVNFFHTKKISDS